MAEGTPTTLNEAVEAAPATEPTESKRAGFDIQAVLHSPAFVPGLVMLAGIMALFWDVMKFLPDLWLSEDGYYSHGFLVPLISGYIVYRNWDKIKSRPVRPQWWPIPLLIGCLFVARVAAATNIYNVASAVLIVVLLLSVITVAGWEWFKALFFPIVYLAFCLPLFQNYIELYTNSLQVWSTKVAYSLLSLGGFNPHADDATTILLPNFVLNIAVPCSGLKLLLALGAFTMFFMLIARLKLWANLVMLALWFPLALFINGLRIALIGVVGNMYGEEAGLKFHDYSGYLTLLLCFYILFRVARGLGWKD